MSSASPDSAIAEAESLAYRVVPVENGAVVRGRVRFRGRRPYPAPLPVLRRHATCGTFKGAAPFRIDRTQRTLGDAVVWLSGIRAGRAATTELKDIALQGCEFQPFVVALTVGSSVRITSHDDTIHALTARWVREKPSSWFQYPFPVPGVDLYVGGLRGG